MRSTSFLKKEAKNFCAGRGPLGLRAISFTLGEIDAVLLALLMAQANTGEDAYDDEADTVDGDAGGAYNDAAHYDEGRDGETDRPEDEDEDEDEDGDTDFEAQAIQSALDKIIATLPDEAIPFTGDAARMAMPKLLTAAIAAERKLSLRYADKKAAATQRIIWPIYASPGSNGYLIAWCELRADFRQFRLDRIQSVSLCADRYPRPARLLRAEFRVQQMQQGEDW